MSRSRYGLYVQHYVMPRPHVTCQVRACVMYAFELS